MKRIEVTTSTFKSFDGLPVYYEVRGEGEPIIMVYGIACLMNHWFYQLKYFSKTHKTIVYDLRGHHKTGVPSDPSTLNVQALAQDLACLMDHLKIKKAHFMGHSFGAPIMLELYRSRPELFKSFIIINGFAKNPLKGFVGFNALEAFYKHILNTYKDWGEFWSFLWKASVTNPLAVYLSSLAGGFNLSLTSLKDIQIYARGVASLEVDVFANLFDQLLKYDGEDVLEMIDVPAMVISGQKDGITPQKHQRFMHEKIKGSQFLSVPYGSHCTQLDLPEFINLAVEKFINQVDSQQSVVGSLES